MPPVAAVLLAWSAVAGYAVLFHGALYFHRRPRGRGHRAYALLAATHVGYALGLAGTITTEIPQRASLALRTEYACGLLMAAAFFQLATTMMRSRLDRLTSAAWVSMGVGAIASLAGLTYGDPDAGAWQEAGAGIDASRIVPPVTALGAVFAFASIGWSMIGLGTLILRARDPVEARVMALAAVPALAASLYQGGVHAGGGSAGWLFDLTTIPIALAAGWVLLRRFARNASELSAQSAALTQRYDQLRRTQDALVRKEQLAAVGELSAVIAHEVRNPLAILKNAVSGLRQRALDVEDRRVLLGIVHEETDRLARLVRDLLAYARPLSPVRAPARLRELVERAWADPRLGKTKGQAELAVEIRADVAVLVDREHASYAIVNVLDNALAALGGQGTVRVRASSTASSGRTLVALEITDDGPGMDAQVLDKAREPFFTTRPSGTGLGLAIVDRVMRGHDGALEIESVPGDGTRVRLVFPAYEGHEVPEAAPRQAPT